MHPSSSNLKISKSIKKHVSESKKSYRGEYGFLYTQILHTETETSIVLPLLELVLVHRKETKKRRSSTNTTRTRLSYGNNGGDGGWSHVVTHRRSPSRSTAANKIRDC